MEREHNGNLSLVKNIYSSQDPNWKYFYGMEPIRNGEKIMACAVPM